MSIEQYNQGKLIQSAKSHLPQYEDNFGHVAEDIIRESILEKAGIVIERIEKGSKVEDLIKKIDFWIKFKYLDEPIAIQYTCTNSPNNIKKKENYLRSINHVVPKEPKENAEIDWTGRAHILMVRGDMKEMARCWDESRKKGTTPAKEIGDKFIVDFIRQVINEMGKINPIMKKMIMDAMTKAAAEKGKNKRG